MELVEVTRRIVVGTLPIAALAVPALARATGDSTAGKTFRDLYSAEWAWRDAQYPDEDDPKKPIPAFLPDESPAGPSWKPWPPA